MKIPVNIQAIDAISGGGLTEGSLVEMFGPEYCGKTTTALRIASNLGQMGMQTLFIDTEHSLSKHYIERVKSGHILISDVSDESEVYDIIKQFSKLVKLVVIDSFAGMLSCVSHRMFEKDILFQHMVTSGYLRKIKHIAMENNLIVIFINQIRFKEGTGTKSFGSRSLKFLADLRIRFYSPYVQHGDVMVSVKCVKNKLAKPFLTSTINLSQLHNQ